MLREVLNGPSIGGLLLAVAVATTACNEAPTTGPGPGGYEESDLAILNSISGTLQQFNIEGEELIPWGQAYSLGSGGSGRGADSGDSLDDLWATTSGSDILYGSFDTGETVITSVPGIVNADLGRPTVITQPGQVIAVLVPSRARNEIYIGFPGTADALLVAEEVGEYVMRVVPHGAYLVSVDANLDDASGTMEPLGPPRIALHHFATGSPFDQVTLPPAVGALDAIVVGDNLAVVSSGSVDPVTFSPAGDGVLFEFNITGRGVQDVNELGGNAVSMEGGRDGLAYIVRTKGAGTFDTDVLTFNYAVRAFERGPDNPLQPKDEDGSDLNCYAVSAHHLGGLVCITYVTSGPGRLVLLDEEGNYLDEAPIGAGATDILLRA